MNFILILRLNSYTLNAKYLTNRLQVGVPFLDSSTTPVGLILRLQMMIQ